ncbi:MAG TPA: hypothetical protein VFS08_05550 [Gemmatimonadaceae bacterium]|nr:hypothetical protein [Gemmatimonadaceae bacterium]
MTQYFAYQRFKLWRAPLQTRVLLTLFNTMIVLATGVGMLMYQVRTGLTPAGAQAYYLGNEGTAGPGDEMLFARSFKELLDVTHDHAFSQPFLFFVLCHIFALTRVSDRVKIGVYVASFGSVLVDLASPYLIRYVSPAFAPLQIAGSIVMTLALLVLLAVPTYEMWLYREPPASMM